MAGDGGGWREIPHLPTTSPLVNDQMTTSGSYAVTQLRSYAVTQLRSYLPTTSPLVDDQMTTPPDVSSAPKTREAVTFFW